MSHEPIRRVVFAERMTDFAREKIQIKCPQLTSASPSFAVAASESVRRQPRKTGRLRGPEHGLVDIAVDEVADARHAEQFAGFDAAPGIHLVGGGLAGFLVGATDQMSGAEFYDTREERLNGKEENIFIGAPALRIHLLRQAAIRTGGDPTGAVRRLVATQTGPAKPRKAGSRRRKCARKRTLEKRDRLRRLNSWRSTTSARMLQRMDGAFAVASRQ